MKTKPVKDNVKLEYIEWIDSTARDGWHLPDPDPEEGMDCISVGWITAETETAITVTCHIMLGNPRFHHSDMNIPKAAIKKRYLIEAES